MEHSIRPLDLAHPWRTATVVATAVAALELILIFVLAVAAFGNPIAREVRNAAAEAEAASMRPATPKPVPAGKPKLARGEMSVLVLNGNGRTGAAGDAAARVKLRGYLISGVGNAMRSDHTRTVVMYRPGYRAEGERLARDLRIKLAAPLDGMPLRALMGAQAVVIVGDS